MKLPVPVPSMVLEAVASVGLELISHTTPRAVTPAPPSLVMVPPLTALAEPIDVVAAVLSVGRLADGLGGVRSSVFFEQEYKNTVHTASNLK